MGSREVKWFTQGQPVFQAELRPNFSLVIFQSWCSSYHTSLPFQALCIPDGRWQPQADELATVRHSQQQFKWGWWWWSVFTSSLENRSRGLLWPERGTSGSGFLQPLLPTCLNIGCILAPSTPPHQSHWLGQECLSYNFPPASSHSTDAKGGWAMW